MVGFLLVGGALGFLPNILEARWLFGDLQIALVMMMRPLPAWVAIAGFLTFPLLQGLAEIPTYMLDVQPRLERQGLRPWLATALTAISYYRIFTI